LGDVHAMMPPTAFAWVRRVRGENLWVWYRFGDTRVSVVALTTHPPLTLAP
jgi:hypothetical protein